MDIRFDQIKSYSNGKAGLITGLCEQIGVNDVFNQLLTQPAGRPPEIPYGTLAQMMLVNIADDHHPLSRMHDYFEDVDLEAIFGIRMDPAKINDDRFGGFLDLMQNAGCSSILSEIAVRAFKRYGIKLGNVNFDTTSKVMWGQYETPEGIEGVVDISFGYSKQNRPDKKQIKLSMGTTQGICIDGQVLSGNQDDKRFNIDNLDRAAELRERFESAANEFFYIADSAAFTKEFLEKAQRLEVKVITRMPDQIKETKAAIEYAATNLESMTRIEIPTSTKPAVYRIAESSCSYYDAPLKMAVCYSENLESTKRQTIDKRVAKELDVLEKLIKRIEKRSFACREDAQLEIEKLRSQDFSKIKYHRVEISMDEVTVKRRGRPSKTPENDIAKTTFELVIDLQKDIESIENAITKECIFVVVSTEMSMSAEAILREYKTQSAVERKFQFLKSPQFVNALYVDSPKRVEAIGYLMLILMLILSVAEYVVRRELESEKKTIIGPGNVKMSRPSLVAIHGIFYSVVTSTVTIGKVVHRGYNKPLRDNVRTVMRYLGIPEDLFIRGVV